MRFFASHKFTIKFFPTSDLFHFFFALIPIPSVLSASAHSQRTQRPTPRKKDEIKARRMKLWQGRKCGQPNMFRACTTSLDFEASPDSPELAAFLPFFVPVGVASLNLYISSFSKIEAPSTQSLRSHPQRLLTFELHLTTIPRSLLQQDPERQKSWFRRRLRSALMSCLDNGESRPRPLPCLRPTDPLPSICWHPKVLWTDNGNHPLPWQAFHPHTSPRIMLRLKIVPFGAAVDTSGG